MEGGSEVICEIGHLHTQYYTPQQPFRTQDAGADLKAVIHCSTGRGKPHTHARLGIAASMYSGSRRVVVRYPYHSTGSYLAGTPMWVRNTYGIKVSHLQCLEVWTLILRSKGKHSVLAPLGGYGSTPVTSSYLPWDTTSWYTSRLP